MNFKIGIIGLGYVGLPLAVEFSKKYPTVGFDINKKRVDEISTAYDETLEISKSTLQSTIKTKKNDLETSESGLFCTTKISNIKDCNFYIVTVPTPVDKNNRPILTPLLKASETVGLSLKKGDYVVFESTVYPGVTEDECVPVLESFSGLKLNIDFFVGYSPERINPGDKNNTLTKIIKVTSGSDEKSSRVINNMYSSIIEAGTYLAPSIKVAEAAKVIENSQRDINIAFVNELAKIFNLLEIDTHSVLKAASTKWNFLNFKPGLVGGHCIGVDPYYLAQKAQELGYHSEIILSGRRLNDGMGKYVASEIIKKMIMQEIKISQANILILGITFKENCPDIRNSKVIDLYNELSSYKVNLEVYDPWANKNQVEKEFGFQLINKPFKKYEAVILAVSHHEFLVQDLSVLKSEKGIIYDIKGDYDDTKIDYRL